MPGICGNSSTDRFFVRIKYQRGSIDKKVIQYVFNGFYPMKNFTTVGDLSTGSYGSVDMKTYATEYSTANTRRKIDPLALQLRLTGSPEDILVNEAIEEWWANQNDSVCDIFVDITDRKLCLREQYAYYGCTFKDNRRSGISMGSPTIGIKNLLFLPVNIERTNVYGLLKG